MKFGSALMHLLSVGMFVMAVMTCFEPSEGLTKDQKKSRQIEINSYLILGWVVANNARLMELKENR